MHADVYLAQCNIRVLAVESRSHRAPGASLRGRELVIETYIDVLEWAPAIAKILHWAKHRESRSISVCNVHSVVAARSDPILREAINGSDMATPDGMPIAWLISHRQGRTQPRVSGMELTLALCAEAEAAGVVVSFYGSQPGTLDRLRASLTCNFPKLKIGTMISPPYRQLTPEELSADILALNDSGAGIVFVGLGCPKQEVWMHANRSQIAAVQIGVGAVFDFMAGTIKRPPVWMQNAGLEWFGRLISEPRRLWRRYFVTNSLFLAWLLQDLVTNGRASSRSPRM